MTKPILFDSTVALTFYNLLCQSAEVGATEDTLYQRAKFMQHRSLEADQAKRALDGLMQRGWVTKDAEIFKVKDPQRRIVVRRDTSEAQASLGEREGGWEHWMVRDGNQLTSIDRAVAGVIV